MEKHIIRLDWSLDSPCLEYRLPYGNSRDLLRLSLSQSPIAFKILERRICVGSLSLLDLKMSPCKYQKDMTKQKQRQCYICSQSTGFQTCITCKGQTCDSDSQDAISYCSNDHHVYLAYYPGDLVKVGTTAAIRKEQRLLEQGAEFALIVATGDGMIVRAIEKACSTIGYTQLVRKDYKIKMLLEKSDLERASKVLIQAYHDIYNKLDKAHLRYFHEPELMNFAEKFQTKLINSLPAYVAVSPGLDIFGEYVTIKGDILIFRQNHNLFAISLDQILGHLITDIKGAPDLIELRSEAQLSLF